MNELTHEQLNTLAALGQGWAALGTVNGEPAWFVRHAVEVKV